MAEVDHGNMAPSWKMVFLPVFDVVADVVFGWCRCRWLLHLPFLRSWRVRWFEHNETVAISKVKQHALVA